MTAIALRLLRGYMLRSAWLYAFFGVVQFLLTELYWVKGFPRVTVPAALLVLWGRAAALNAHSLVWRSLPLTYREASIFRWFAIAGVPGVWIALCDLITWAALRTSSQLPAPAVETLLQSILVSWAAVSVVAALPLGWRYARGRYRVPFATALVILCAGGIIYGLPTYSASATFFAVFIALGLGALTFSVIKAARGELWGWPDLANRASRSQHASTPWAEEPRFGIHAILLPLLKGTAAVALAATCGIALLYRIFPNAGALLFWGYFIGISTTGFALTYQIRSAIQTLRILPLSAKQLAGMLQFFGALPGLGTLAMTLLINATLLHVKLDPVQFATFALIIIGSQALPLPQPLRPLTIGPRLWKWLQLVQRFFWVFYIGAGAVVLSYGGAFRVFWWFKWPLIGGGVVLCVAGFYITVHHLRSGIRPSSNESVFSAR